LNSYKKIKVKVEVKQLSAEAKVKVEQLSAEVKAKNSEKRILNPPSRIHISYFVSHISYLVRRGGFLSRIWCFISRISNVSHISTCAEGATSAKPHMRELVTACHVLRGFT
jgi:hypothetical protein